MKKISTYSLVFVVFGLSISNFLYHDYRVNDNEFSPVNLIKEDYSGTHQETTLEANDVTITIRDIATFLSEKKEHYPLSDEFIEKYQQKSGGYIDFAKQTGQLVDKQRHEPNQKWHFFESWLNESLLAGTITWEDSAQVRVYSKLLCPELLLWIYEACGVDPVKVKKAKDVAEQGKVANTATATIAKNMRNCVSWDDFHIVL